MRSSLSNLKLKDSVAKQKKKGLTENIYIKGIAFNSTIHLCQKTEISCFWSMMEFFESCRIWQTWPLLTI